MKEDQGNSQLSMATTQNPKPEEQSSQVTVMKRYYVSIILILTSFNFLIFAMVELITNYSEHRYTADFSCSDYQCTAQLTSISFPTESTIYFYLHNSKISQNILEPFSVNYEEVISGCQTYSTNEKISKNISMTGSVLNGSSLAYPCGQIAMLYPQGTFSVRNTATSQLLTLGTDDLFISSYGFKNQNLNQQWADVESSRYFAWSEANIARGIRKYWGYLTEKIPQNIQITLTTTNPMPQQLKSGLQLIMSDGLALSGYNIPLCSINFIWAFLLFMLAWPSFWIMGKSKLKNGQSDLSVKSQPDQQQCAYTYQIHS